MSALTLIDDLLSSGSQLIIATHSPIIMAYPEAFIYEFAGAKVRKVQYEQTEHFRVTRDFFNQREQMLDILLARLPL